MESREQIEIRKRQQGNVVVCKLRWAEHDLCEWVTKNLLIVFNSNECCRRGIRWRWIYNVGLLRELCGKPDERQMVRNTGKIPVNINIM